MNVSIENDFQKRVMYQACGEPTHLSSKADVAAWRIAWSAGLKNWHSPYKVVVDCSNLSVSDTPEVRDALALMMRFFEGLFLKKAVGFGRQEGKGHEILPFEVFEQEESALETVGVREPRGPREPTDFRSAIQIQNHFTQHVMELSFSHPVILASAEQVGILKSKLTNNLMQWHSKWSLLIDCANLEFGPEAVAPFAKMLAFFQGFFLKNTLGYTPRGTQESYPFKVYRARHNAAGRLEAEGMVAGDDAVCQTKKA